MPRVKIVNFDDDASGSTNPREPARERVNRRAILNPDFEERLRVFETKECHTERGIDVSELEHTPVPRVVQARGWEDFVLNPPPYCERIVREFYAGIVVKDYYNGCAVIVRGKQVKIQAADINRYHKTTLANPIPIGVEHQTLFLRQNMRFANSLVVEPMHRWHSKERVDMNDPGLATSFYLPLGVMDAATWKGLQKKSKKIPVPAGQSHGPSRKKRRKAATDDDDRWYSEAALQDDVDATVGDEGEIPRDSRPQTPVDRILAAIKENQGAIQQVEASIHKRLDQMDEDWGFDMTELRRELGLSVYSRRRRGPTASTPSAAPRGGPIIDEGGALRRAMELSRKEAEDRAAAEKDPKGKRVA
ncbi:hypothetical protein LWI29_006417 [Acer saccharum]|uniref:Uncharacterized protein n=1 Tax=Acer saccharum TaxID=4024 RepID=A0AA39T1E3_ACESA|nr:hypothetical protein LWI29_006417 [Acer saccharum]